jgi:predicted nucleic-acid-binding Zn-ribbon protein
MKSSGECPKCSSRDLIKDAKAVDRGDYNSGHDLSVATYRNPDALIFKGKHESPLSAWVCRTCGFVELYADSPPALGVFTPPPRSR